MTVQRPGAWITSSYSGEQGACVEVMLGPAVRVRDTKDRSGPEITLPSAAWIGLLDHLATKPPA